VNARIDNRQAALTRSQSLVGLGAALVLVASLVAVFWQLRGPSTSRFSTTEWYYDLNTGQLFAAPLGEIPPIAAPSGPLPDGSPAGVRAHVYGCGDCSEANRTIAYLETYTPEDRQRLQALLKIQFGKEPPSADSGFMAGPEDGILLAGQGSLVKRPEDADWVRRIHPEGQALVSDSLPRCHAGVFPLECRP